MRHARRYPLVLAVAAVIALATTAYAWGGATVGTFHFEEPVTFATSLPECLPTDLVGTQSGVEITDGQTVETPGGAFEVRGTTRFDYRVEFPDGRYVIGSAPSQFGFQVSPGGTFVSNTVVHETRSVYGASGDRVGSATIHANSHMTFHDTSGNGLPDPGEITSSVDRFSFTCK